MTRAHLGINYQHPRGFFIGTGLAWNLPTEERIESQSENREKPFGDYWDWQVRIGYHPGVRVYVPPPPPAPPAAAAAAAGPQPDGQGGLRSVHGAGRDERRR